jgi:uncharacterized membrane protein
MRAKTRKLVGTVLLLLFLSAYAAVAGLIGAGRISSASPLAQFAFFLAAGLVWVLPAGLLIRWMQRPDGEAGVKRR